LWRRRRCCRHGGRLSLRLLHLETAATVNILAQTQAQQRAQSSFHHVCGVLRTERFAQYIFDTSGFQDGANGFAIGSGETHTSIDIHDARDYAALDTVLRNEVIPLYYQRDRDGVPRGWIKRMKRAIRTLGWRFSADRMVMDYTLKSYIPAAGGTSSDMSRM